MPVVSYLLNNMAIDTPVDGIKLGAGLENLATVMDKATVLRTLTNATKFGAIHLKAQYYLMTGYLSPAGFKAPSVGAVLHVGTALGGDGVKFIEEDDGALRLARLRCVLGDLQVHLQLLQLLAGLLSLLLRLL